MTLKIEILVHSYIIRVVLGRSRLEICKCHTVSHLVGVKVNKKFSLHTSCSMLPSCPTASLMLICTAWQGQLCLHRTPLRNSGACYNHKCLAFEKSSAWSQPCVNVHGGNRLCDILCLHCVCVCADIVSAMYIIRVHGVWVCVGCVVCVSPAQSVCGQVHEVTGYWSCVRYCYCDWLIVAIKENCLFPFRCCYIQWWHNYLMSWLFLLLHTQQRGRVLLRVGFYVNQSCFSLVTSLPFLCF